jgi:hypothetical protein
MFLWTTPFPRLHVRRLLHAYYANGSKHPAALPYSAVRAAQYRAIMGKQYGSAENPLLVTSLSAPASHAGMMDTV